LIPHRSQNIPKSGERQRRPPGAYYPLLTTRVRPHQLILRVGLRGSMLLQGPISTNDECAIWSNRIVEGSQRDQIDMHLLTLALVSGSLFADPGMGGGIYLSLDGALW